MTALNTLENTKRRKLERTIESGLKSFVEVGQALAEIRDSKLYRDTHKSFEAYCAERWKIKRQRAYDLIEASGVAERVSQISDTQPKESHAAELSKLPEPAQAEAWQEVCETTDKPTAKAVKAVVEKRLPDRAAIVSVPDYADEEFEPAEPDPNSDLDAVKSGYLALSFAKQIAMCDFIQDNPPKGD